MNSLCLTAFFFSSLYVLIGKYRNVIFVTASLKDPEIPSRWHHTLQEFTAPRGIYDLNTQEKKDRDTEQAQKNRGQEFLSHNLTCQKVMPMSGPLMSLFFQAMGRNTSHPTYFKCLPSPKVNLPYKWLQTWVETQLSPVWITVFKRKDATITRFIHRAETTHKGSNWCQPRWFNGANPPQPFPEAKVRPYATAISNCPCLRPQRNRLKQKLNWTMGR